MSFKWLRLEWADNHLFIEISAVKQYLVDIDQIDALEDGHLNLTEIRLLEGYLDRCQVSWNQAWMSCLKDFNDNHYTTGKYGC